MVLIDKIAPSEGNSAWKVMILATRSTDGERVVRSRDRSIPTPVTSALANPDKFDGCRRSSCLATGLT